MRRQRDQGRTSVLILSGCFIFYPFGRDLPAFDEGAVLAAEHGQAFCFIQTAFNSYALRIFPHAIDALFFRGAGAPRQPKCREE